jgi:hypothetical protein
MNMSAPNTPQVNMSLDPALLSQSIPPQHFYGLPQGSYNFNSPHPPLHPLSQGMASTPSSTNPSRPSTKKHEEFLLADLDQLLRAVIEVNPFMAPCNLVSMKWKEVVTQTQSAKCCLGCDLETLKNKISSLLAWCEVHVHPLAC